MSGLKILVIVFTAVLTGMKTVYGIWECKGSKDSFWSVWNSRWLYISGVVSLGADLLLLFLVKGEFYYIRYADLLYTYILLAAVDIKTRKVPDRILLLFMASQILMAGVDGIREFVSALPGGLIFSVIIVAVSLTSSGKMGLGDGKLLAVTAIAAGFGYTLAVLCSAMVLSVLYGVWLLLFRHLSAKEEIPFVPFLCLGTVIHFIYFL